MQLSDGRRPRLFVAACIGVAAVLGSHASDVSGTQGTAPSAVVVDAVEQGSAGQKAGIRPGDRLQRWERAANPPANPSAAAGDLLSVFDLTAIEIEQAPRGPVTLHVLRGTERVAVMLPFGRWGITVRPAMSAVTAKAHAEARALAAAGRIDRALAAWRAAAQDAVRIENDQTIPAWLLAQASATLQDPSAAHAALGEALSFAERARHQAAIGALHDLRGQLFERQKDAAGAERAYRAAMTARQGGGAPNFGTAKGLVDLAFVAIGRGDFPSAEQRFREAIDLQRQLAPVSFVLAKTLANLAKLVSMRGDLDEAGSRLRDAAALLERLAPDTAEFALALNNLGAHLWQRGDLSGAAATYERALRIQERSDPSSRDVAVSLANIAQVLARQGKLAQAERSYRRALSIYERIGAGTADEAEALNQFGNLLLNRGDLPAAEEFHLRALAIRERIAPNSTELAASLNNLGKLANHRGDAVRAHDYYTRALAIMERLSPDSLDTARVLNNLGLVAAGRGDLTAAETLLKRALALKERNAPGTADVASTLINLGDMRANSGDLPAALTFYESARAVLEKAAPEGLELATVLGNLADLAERRNNAAEASALATRALAMIERLAPDSDTHAQGLRRLGLQAFRKREFERAAGFFERSVTALESQTIRLGGSSDIRTAFAAQSHDYYVEYIDSLIALRQPARAFEVLERSRARGLLLMLAERDLLLDAGGAGALVESTRELNEQYDRAQEALAGLNPARDAAEIERLQTRLRDLRESRARAIDKIRAASPRLAALQYPKPLGVTEMQQALDPGTVLLSYHIGKQQSQLFVLQAAQAGGSPRLTVHSVPLGSDVLREEVEAFRRQIERQEKTRGGVTPAFVELSRRLFDVLVGPAQHALTSSERVLLSPDGPLHSLPFAALATGDPAKDGRPWQYFVEWKPLHTVLSATVYAELKKADVVTSNMPTLVAFGDPAYPSAAEGGAQTGNPDMRGMLQRGYALAQLPASRIEVQALARHFGMHATTYLGADATEARAKAVGKARYLHFATHGLLDARSPLNSALALTVPSKRKEAEENGLLQAWEIFEQMRIDADLVTLSACETALGEELAGEGLIGLTRAFHYAGARSVLASLWRVADESTADLMTSVYRHLRSGVTKDEALRRAQLEAIARPRTAAPFHWAAFTLSGDWRSRAVAK